MAKNNERNLNVTIQNQEEDKSEVVISISAIFKKLKKYFAIWVAIAVIAGLLSFCYSAYKTFSTKTPSQAIVSFTYDGIENGLAPDGGDFNIESMKNPKVIEQALTSMGLDLKKVEDIRANISFDHKVPQEAYDQLQAYSSVMSQASGGNLSAAQAMLDTKYYPTQFTVKFDFNKAGFDRQTGVDFFNTLLKCYGDYFYDEYGYNEPLGAAVSAVDYQTYDYAQQVDVFRNSLRQVKNYLDDLSEDDKTTFRSSVTGYTFNDLSEYADTVTSIDLDTISSYISVNNVTKDKESTLAYYDYKVENLNRSKDEYTERIASIDASIAAYQKDVINIYGNGNDNIISQGTIHSEAYDEMFKDKSELEEKLAQAKQDINFYNSRREALKNNKTSSKGNIEKVEADIVKLSEKVTNIVELTEKTASDYYENVQFANAYNILVPATKSVSAGIGQAASDSVKSIVIVEMLILAIYIAVSFINAIKTETRKKAAKAGLVDDVDDDDDDDEEELEEAVKEEAEKTSGNANNSKNNKKKKR